MNPPARNPWHTAAVGLLLTGFALLFWDLGGGALSHVDELLTAERSRELALGQFPPVHFNFSTDQKKPPLQYLATAAFQTLIPDPELSVRLFPALCALALLLLLHRGGPAFGPPHPAFPALAVLLFLSYHDALYFSRSGLLDSGNAFLVFAVTLLAWRARTSSPGLWWAAAALAGAGGLHKNALALLVYAAALLPLPGAPSPWRNRHWWGGLGLALLLALSWPLLLSKFSDTGSSHEYLTGHPGTPARHALSRRFLFYPAVILDRWRGFALLALAALLALPFARSWRRQPAVAWLAVVSLLLYLSILVPGKCSFRYAYIPFITLLPLSTLFLLWCKDRLPPRLWAAGLAFLILSVLPGWTRHYARTWNIGLEEKETSLRLARHLPAASPPWQSLHAVRPLHNPSGFTPAHLLYYAQLDRRVTNWTPGRWPEPGSIPRPALGFAHRNDWPAVQKLLPETTAMESSGPYVIWQLP